MGVSYSGGIAVKGGGLKTGLKPPPPPTVDNAVNFDGTNDWLTRGAQLSGPMADSSLGILSMWIKHEKDEIDGAITKYIGDNVSFFEISRNNISGGNTVRIRGRNTAFSTRLDILTDATILAAEGWVHILASWNLNTATTHLYKNDETHNQVIKALSGPIDHTTTVSNWGVMHQVGGSSNLMEGDVAEFYFNSAEYLDFSIESNRRKFVTAGGEPADLGSDGSTPTSTSPRIYFSGDASSFSTNKGTGGAFTLTGSLDTAATAPSF